MKRLWLIAAGFVLATVAVGQTPEQHEKKKAEMKDLKTDVVEKREENKEMEKHITHAKFKKAVGDRKDKRAEKRHIRKDETHLKNQGVKHPVAKVKHELKAEKELKKAKY
ncbi:MAG: hypothetical protein ABJB86_02875 [Bacteroidota bacterium]